MNTVPTPAVMATLSSRCKVMAGNTPRTPLWDFGDGCTTNKVCHRQTEGPFWGHPSFLLSHPVFGCVVRLCAGGGGTNSQDTVFAICGDLSATSPAPLSRWPGDQPESQQSCTMQTE